ncbi:auxin-responsive protein SAUR50-like [Impatiens glandulifera]|uniref:auxin-responsive protein SAUR50-like n=1 Tax=Impatiens glandulifera TaxID=253017 RepID=UPI001FB18336|nr:auxin-responsive protein SAUR50-like [Impatiens glandulifera]
MSPVIGKSNKIRHVVRIKQMLQRWRIKSSSPSPASIILPPDVPAGHVAIYVGRSCRRFVVRATYLNHPVFHGVLAQAAEEYGFLNQGPLALPCDESIFEEIIRFISRPESGNLTRFLNLQELQRCCHVAELGLSLDPLVESQPLIHLLDNKPIC